MTTEPAPLTPSSQTHPLPFIIHRLRTLSHPEKHPPSQFPYAFHMVKQVKLPTFSGMDPRGWLTRTETYFQIHGTPNDHRLPLAHICMEGVASHWFCILRELHHNMLWDDFKTELLNCFGGVANLSRYEQLATLHQRGTVDDFIDQFEPIASMIPRETEALYLGYFMNGLHDAIKKLGKIARTGHTAHRLHHCQKR